MTATAPLGDAGDPTAPAAPADRCPGCHAPVTSSWLACASCGRRLAVDAELGPGTVIGDGRFSVRRVIGRGGFGITYEVDDRRLHRCVAVKELFPESAVRHGSLVLTPPQGRVAFQEAKDRFLREARVLARFSHPGIVRVFEVFEEHNTAYLVLELLHGRTLSEVLKAGGHPFTEDQALDVARWVTGALAAVHRAGLLHRDISPSNLVCTDDGRTVLIDFGLARSFDAGQTAAMTRIVTPGYAPPEQYLGAARFGPATDVYALAATLYRLLTLRTPPSAIERQHGNRVAPPHRLNPAVSKLVSDAVLDGLELRPEHRPQSVAAFLDRLGAGPTPPASLSASVPDDDATVLEPGRVGSTAAAPAPAVAPVHAPTARAAPASAVGPARVPAVDAVPAPAPAAGPGAAPAPAMAPPAVSATMPASPARGADPGPASATVVAVPAAAPAPAAGRAAVPSMAPPPLPVRAHPGRPVPGPPHHQGPAMYGPPPSGRWKVAVPVAAAGTALMSAAPVLFLVVLGLLVLPAAATWGDVVEHRRRQLAGMGEGWLARRSPSVLVAPRFVRNVVAGAVRALPPTVLLAVLIGCWYPIDSIDGATADTVARWFLRGVGVAVGLALVVPAVRGSARFASGVAVDEATIAVAPGGSTLTQRGWILWAVALGLTAAGLAFSPEVWPLPF